MTQVLRFCLKTLYSYLKDHWEDFQNRSKKDWSGTSKKSSFWGFRATAVSDAASGPGLTSDGLLQRTPRLLKSQKTSFELFIAHKHHNVPGEQTKKGRHEAVNRKRQSGKRRQFFFIFIFYPNSPLIESCGSLFDQHSCSTIQSPTVLPRH